MINVKHTISALLALVLLLATIAHAHELLDGHFEELFKISFAEGSRWAFPASMEFVKAVQSHYADPNLSDRRSRGLLFTYIFSLAVYQWLYYRSQVAVCLNWFDFLTQRDLRSSLLYTAGA